MPDDTSYHLDASTIAGRLDTATRSATYAVDRVELRLPGLTILCHPDLRRVGERAVLPALTSNQEAHLSRLEPLFSQPGSDRRRPLADPRLSRSPLILRPGDQGEIELTNPTGKVRITADGQPIVGSRRWNAEEIADGVVWLIADQVALVLHLMDPLTPDEPSFGLVGESLGIQNVRRQIARVADLEVPCLIRGETGTGKELVANAIHRASGRRSRPFEAINMGAIPPTLAASELFGASKGAFTGADRKRDGAFVRADGGTLFMDEVGETPSDIQALLLRALETSLVRPVGADREQKVSVRILAATDADLENAIEEGKFRGPLVHRLSGYELNLPPLRQRKEDLGRLIFHFLKLELGPLGELERLDQRHQKAWLPAPLVARLAAYSWPGNIRQLRNIVRQLVIANRGESRLRLTKDLEKKLLEDASASESSRAEEPAVRTTESIGSEPGTRKNKAGIRAFVAFKLQTSDHSFSVALSKWHQTLRTLMIEYEGEVVDNNSECFSFEDPAEAVGAALEFQQVLAERRSDLGSTVVGRTGISLGRIQPLGEEGHPQSDLPDAQKAVALRQLALPGQILMDRSAYELTRRQVQDDHPLADPVVSWREHGVFNLEHLSSQHEVFEVGLEEIAPLRPPDEPKPAKRPYRSPDEVDEQELLAVLKAHAFRLQPAAAALNVSRTSLYALIEKSTRIRKAKDLTRDEITRAVRRHGHDLDAAAAELEVSRKGLRRQMTSLGFD